MKNTKELLETALELLKQQIDFIFATVIETTGSSPRGAGTHMLVAADGAVYGTVGGGNVEYQSILFAKKLLAEKRSRKKEYILRPNEVADLGMVCGGEVTVYFQYIPWQEQAFGTLCKKAVSSFLHRENCWLILDITDDADWKASLFCASGALHGAALPSDASLCPASAKLISLDGHMYYSEPLACGSSVYVFGGGHVAQELIPLLSHLDFRCVIYDDRADFSSKELFPSAAEHITADFAEIARHITVTEQDYICIMSRGHQYDYEIQKQILRTPARYIGVIGSRRKKEAIQKKLLNDGFTAEDLARITTPIGLNILAETPAEIAVSIAGQLILHRADAQAAAASPLSF